MRYGDLVVVLLFVGGVMAAPNFRTFAMAVLLICSAGMSYYMWCR